MEFTLLVFLCLLLAQRLEADITVREEQVQKIGEMANALVSANHFNADKIQTQHMALVER